jgi:hypothetical protein
MKDMFRLQVALNTALHVLPLFALDLNACSLYRSQAEMTGRLLSRQVCCSSIDNFFYQLPLGLADITTESSSVFLLLLEMKNKFNILYADFCVA